MRFGLIPLRFDSAAERIVVNGKPDLSRFDMVRFVEEALQVRHISVIELTMDVSFIVPGSFDSRCIEELARIKDEEGIAYTAHLPLWSVEISTFNTHVREASVETVVGTIELLEPISPEVYVLHSTGALAAEFTQMQLPAPFASAVRGFMAGFSETSVEDILTRTEIDPRKLALENVEFPFEYTREIADRFDTGICFDTGHLLARYSGSESVTEFYRRNRDRIVEIHLHDGSYREENGRCIRRDHIPLGHGEMPVREFLLELMRDGYRGPLILELDISEAIQSLSLVEEIAPESLR